MGGAKAKNRFLKQRGTGVLDSVSVKPEKIKVGKMGNAIPRRKGTWAVGIRTEEGRTQNEGGGEEEENTCGIIYYNFRAGPCPGGGLCMHSLTCMGMAHRASWWQRGHQNAGRRGEASTHSDGNPRGRTLTSKRWLARAKHASVLFDWQQSYYLCITCSTP